MNIFYKVLFSLLLFTPLVEKPSDLPSEVYSPLLATESIFIEDDNTYRIDFSGDFEDFRIPTNGSADRIEFSLTGGDGGTRNSCGGLAEGGKGASFRVAFGIGDGDNDLRPGGLVRLVVGGKGRNQSSEKGGGAGGGGGTGILYIDPNPDTMNLDDIPVLTLEDRDDDWVILAVAGGGGGAFGELSIDPFNASNCEEASAKDGTGGNEGTSGKDGGSANNGGSNGGGGESRLNFNDGGGGGGYLEKGEAPVDNKGGNKGGLKGGNGGFPLENNSPNAAGGFGYGGGGMGMGNITEGPDTEGGGGGGGGFSGGAGGQDGNGTAQNGGGGGSYINPAFIDNYTFFDGAGATRNPEDGHITYRLPILQVSGDEFCVDFSGGYFDLVIPSDLDLTTYDGISFSMRGGDGGKATNTSGLFFNDVGRGGGGAFVGLNFPIGSNPNQLQRGGTLRFIVGGKGSGNRSGRATGAGGGGGSAVLYRPPGVTDDGDCNVFISGAPMNQLPGPTLNLNFDCWVILAVAGGGGGGFARNNQERNGKPGNDTTAGTDGNDDNDGAGGNNGGSGQASAVTNDDAKPGGGGGGYLPLLNDPAIYQGRPGLYTGGDGGTSEDRYLAGGFGYGGGGSGTNADADSQGQATAGGGGGFSGGGGSRRDGGGGGGSFANTSATNVVIEKGGSAFTPNDGFIKYQLFKRNESDIVVNCVTDITARIFGTEEAEISVDSVLIEAFDPDDPGANLDLDICTLSGTACAPKASYNCGENFRTRELLLRARNGSKEGACRFTVTVEQIPIDTIVCPPAQTVEFFDCLGIVSHLSNFNAEEAELQPILRPACGDSLAYAIRRPDGSIDTDHINDSFTAGLDRDTFDFGTSTVFYTSYYEDEDGLPAAQSCSFTITVNQNFAFDCPRDFSVSIPEEECSTLLMHQRFTQELEIDLNGLDCGVLSHRVIHQGLFPDTTEGSGQLSSFEFKLGDNQVDYYYSLTNGEVLNCNFQVEIRGNGNGNREISIECPDEIEISVSGATTEEDIFNEVVTVMGEGCGLTEFRIEDLQLDCDRVGREQRNVLFQIFQVRSGFPVDQCQVDITIRDDIGITCPNDQTIVANPGICEAPFLNNGLSLFTDSYLCSDDLSFAVVGPGLNIPKTSTRSIVAELGGNFPVGDYTFTVFADLRDGSESSNCSYKVSILDAEAPRAICTDIQVAVGDPLDNLAPFVGANAIDNCGIVSYALSGLPEPDADCEPDGLYPVELTVADHAGNTATCLGVVRIIAVAECEDVEVGLDDNGNISIPVTDLYATDINDCRIDEINVDYQRASTGLVIDPIGGGSANPTITTQTSLTYNCNDIGNRLYTLRLKDIFGVESSCNGTITIKDDDAPSFTCPPAMNVSTNDNCQITIPDFGEIIADERDNCGFGVIVGTSPLIQAPFPGTMQNSSPGASISVALSLRDENGNEDEEDCTVVLTVVDDTAPVAICPDEAPSVEIGAIGIAEVLPDLIVGKSTDNCSAVSERNASFLTGCGAIGEISVRLTTTDASGNTGTADCAVNIVDVLPPTFTCPGPMMISTTSEASCEVEIPDFAVLVTDENDNCSLGINTLMQTIPAGPYNPSSSTFEITLSLEDASENLDEEDCTFTITVSDFDDNNNCGAPVPVELLFFHATKTETKALLQWKTASELNNQGFFIERSADASKWQEIGFVQGQGSSTEPLAYEWIDQNPISGSNYYRLKQIDFDGSISYSAIQELNFSSENQSFQIFPNPTLGYLNIDWSPEQNVKGIRVYSIFGEVILQYTTPVKELLLNDLPSGLYWLVLETEQGQLKQRFVKQ